MNKNEPMVTIQGKVPPTIKERIKLHIRKQGISESEFIRELAEDFLNGSGGSNEPIKFDVTPIESKLTGLQEQVAQLRGGLAVSLELILTNLTDEPDEVSDVLEVLRTRNLI